MNEIIDDKRIDSRKMIFDVQCLDSFSDICQRKLFPLFSKQLSLALNQIGWLFYVYTMPFDTAPNCNMFKYIRSNTWWRIHRSKWTIRFNPIPEKRYIRRLDTCTGSSLQTMDLCFESLAYCTLISPDIFLAQIDCSLLLVFDYSRCAQSNLCCTSSCLCHSRFTNRFIRFTRLFRW